MLRLLIWYGALAEAKRTAPVFARLGDVSWKKHGPEAKVLTAMGWLLRTHGAKKFEAEGRLYC